MTPKTIVRFISAPQKCVRYFMTPPQFSCPPSLVLNEQSLRLNIYSEYLKTNIKIISNSSLLCDQQF